MAYPDYDIPFVLQTDACKEELGAVLCQEQEGKLRVIAYASRSLSKAAKNYPAYKLEYLALKWSVAEKFKDYLRGHRFSVFTDNNPLTYVLTTAKLDATGHRWLTALSAYDFAIMYRPGHSNQNADSLSRLPLLQGYQRMTKEAITAISKAGLTANPWAYSLCQPNQDVEMDDPPSATAESTRNWRQLQRDDPIVGYLHQKVCSKQRPKKKRAPRDTETQTLQTASVRRIT